LNKYLFSLFINGENEVVLYWQWFVVYIPFKADLSVT
jgi:hypothetical protein